MLTISRWDQELPYETTLQLLGDLAQEHCRDAGEVASELAVAIRNRDYRSICDFLVDYSPGARVDSLIHLRQALAFFTKLEALDIGVDKEEVAKATFIASELKCRETNALFRMHASGSFTFLPDVEKVLYLAQRKIARVLGDVPSIDSLDLKFGPGATTSIPKKYACARVKLGSKPSCSTNMVGGTVQCLLEALPHYSSLHANGETDDTFQVEVAIVTPRLTFVPKSAKTYRGVRPEPTLNALLQSGYGKDIKRKLMRVGIDLSDQSRNKWLAREGSVTGALATLDLSSASDSISTELVAHLLPYDWYSALSSCRSASCLMPGSEDPLILASFSGMGNGYTFPLQSLIFWALVDAACDVLRLPNGAHRTVSVYGDDIICPVDAYDLIKVIFHSVGFTINTGKSFATGPFRESCGGDYFLGFDVRPYYQKKLLSGITLFALHNHYVTHGMEEYAARVLEYIPEHLRLWGPSGFGDGHLIGDWIPVPLKRDLGWGGHTFDTFVQKGVSNKRLSPGDRVLPVYSVYAQEPSFERSIRMHIAPLAHPKHRDRKVDLNRMLDSEHFDYGVPILPVPGTKGYKRISIYTLGT